MLSARLNWLCCVVLMTYGQVQARTGLFLVAERSATNSIDPGTVALGWNPSPDPRATGYFLCWGLNSSDCTNFLDVGNVTNATVAGLAPNVGYYFTIVTYDAAGDQSPPSNQITATITPASSATALISSQNPSSQGSIVTFTATLTPLAPASTTPTGNVQFYSNGVALGSPVALTDGVASLSTADLPAGTNTVLAAYAGDNNFLSSSNSLAQVVTIGPGTPSTIGIQNNADGTVTVTFAGTPAAQYVVQTSDNLAPPTWANVSTNTAGTDGQWTFTESTEHHPVRFYRSARP